MLCIIIQYKYVNTLAFLNPYKDMHAFLVNMYLFSSNLTRDTKN